jgi:hypothetical protein
MLCKKILTSQRRSNVEAFSFVTKYLLFFFRSRWLLVAHRLIRKAYVN